MSQVDEATVASLLREVRQLASEQRRNAHMLAEVVRRTHLAGASWQQLGTALGITRQTAFRQSRAGDVIVVVRATQGMGSRARASVLAQRPVTRRTTYEISDPGTGDTTREEMEL